MTPEPPPSIGAVRLKLLAAVVALLCGLGAVLVVVLLGQHVL